MHTPCLQAHSPFGVSRAHLYSHAPLFGERCEISNPVRASNLSWLPPTIHNNCSRGCMQGLFWLPWRIKSKQLRTCLTYASSFSLSLFCLCLRYNMNTTLSLQLLMKFGNIVRVEISRYLTIHHDTAEGRLPEARFLQPGIRAQLVAIKRDRMRVPNLKSRSARQRGKRSCPWQYRLYKK